MTKHVEPEGNPMTPRPGSSATGDKVGGKARATRPGLRILAVLVFLAALAVIGWLWSKQHGSSVQDSTSGRNALAAFAVPVVAGTVEQRDMPIYLEGLGTVQAFNTVTVRSQVDGQLVKVAFTEGQDVNTGDVLAQIDPAPFQAQLDQNLAKKAQDEAQLQIAQLTLQRDGQLLTGKILAQQDYDTQKAQVQQLVATVQADQAAIDSAQVSLGYTTIRAPLSGRTGIRQVDQGNIVHASDSNGLVVLTQLRPISVVFTLPEQMLGQIQQYMGAEPLTVYAIGRDNQTSLGQGKLAVIDNQIDTTTGTLRLKANFPNEDLKLWPGQFVNVRLLLTTRKAGTVVPASVVQRGPDGTFAFILSNNVALVRPLKVGAIEGNLALIDHGLVPGEEVIVDGQYKVQAGQPVKATRAGSTNGPPSGVQSANSNTLGSSQPAM